MFWGAFWIIIGFAVIFLLGGGWLLSSDLIDEGFTPNPDQLVTSSGGYDLEEVRYETPLGAMDASFLPERGTTWVIHVHGTNSTPTETEALFAPIQAAGYPQLAVTYRNDDQQPSDPSGYFRYGASEFGDIEAAMDYALENGADRVVFNGFGTGAGHVLAFMFRHRSDRIGGVLMDSPNIDYGQTVSFNLSQRDLPILPFKVPSVLTATTKFLTSLRIGVNWTQIDYVERTGEALNKPVLVHHGIDDMTVPIEESIEFADAEPELIRLVQVAGAGHLESLEVDFDAYMARVLGFLEEVG